MISWDDRSTNAKVKEMIDAKKSLFSKAQLKSIISFTDNDITERTLYLPNKLEPVCYSHLLHLQTQTTIIKKSDRKYVEIKCASKA